MVERDLAKVEVAGSTPVSRSRVSSRSPAPLEFIAPSGQFPDGAKLGKGAVPKW